MNDKLEKDIKILINDGIVSWFLIRVLRQSEEKVRAKIIDKIIYGILGAAFSYKILTFVFRKEINELIEDAGKITKESLLKLVNTIKRFAAKKQK